MIDFNQVPSSVTRLATAAFLQQMTHEQMTAMDPPVAVAFAEEAGIGVEDYIAALRWVSEYFKAHADALRAFAEARRHAN